VRCKVSNGHGAVFAAYPDLPVFGVADRAAAARLCRPSRDVMLAQQAMTPAWCRSQSWRRRPGARQPRSSSCQLACHHDCSPAREATATPTVWNCLVRSRKARRTLQSDAAASVVTSRISKANVAAFDLHDQAGPLPVVLPE